MRNSKIITILSGYNNRAVVSFIRTLEKIKISYAIIARNNDDPIFKTAYKDAVIVTRESEELNIELFQKYLEIIRKKYNVSRCFIAPSTEALNRFLQNNREALEKKNVIIPLVDSALYASISDKMAFCDICRKNGLSVPQKWNNIEDTPNQFVAKPISYFTKEGSVYTPFLIFNNKQKKFFLQTCNPADFFFQEYVQGRSIYLHYYFYRSGHVVKFSQENIVQQPEGKSMIAAISSNYHHSEVAMLYEQLFKKLGFFGLVMVELKICKGINYMIEANPRFWGPSQLFVDAGVNLFEALLNDYGFINSIPTVSRTINTRYFWFGGLLKSLKEYMNLTYHIDSEESFLVSIDEWIKHDIFKRADTIGLFKEEMI